MFRHHCSITEIQKSSKDKKHVGKKRPFLTKVYNYHQHTPSKRNGESLLKIEIILLQGVAVFSRTFIKLCDSETKGTIFVAIIPFQ